MTRPLHSRVFVPSLATAIVLVWQLAVVQRAPVDAQSVPSSALSAHVPLDAGLNFTITSHAGLVAGAGSVPIADTEVVYSVVASDSDRISFQFSVSAPNDAAAGKLLDGVPRSFNRTVRRDEPFSVLLDGRRTAVPAMHVRGALAFTDHKIAPEVWWLDDANNPLTLKWTIGSVCETVTRIDRPNGGETGAGRTVADGLAKSCRSGRAAANERLRSHPAGRDQRDRRASRAQPARRGEPFLQRHVRSRV
jgi:hypothetical protein